jgi:stage II sporulation protein GA (sporulation sigma-E factor processing peptidase)
MDFIVLMAVNSICRYAAGILRIALSAVFGALWAVLVILIPKEYKVITGLLTYLFASTVMIRICAGKSSFKRLLKGVSVLYIVAFMTGGILHFIYYYTYAGYFIEKLLLNNGEMLALTGIAGAVLLLFCKQFIHIGTYNGDLCQICCVIEGEKIYIEGYIDTGNVLTDPFYHKPVCIAEKHLFEEVLGKIKDYTRVKYHVVPFSSLGCESGVLSVIMADSMYINYGKKKIVVENALIGLAENRLSSDSAYNCLVNAQIIRGM